MGHTRIKMELIKKDSTRMQTYQKRKKCLLKKVSEFSILCGVEACIIIFGPEQKDQQVKLEATWPSNSDEVRDTINRYKKTNQTRKCYHFSDYFADKKKKADMEILKLQKQIYDARYPTWHVHLDTYVEDQLRVLEAQLDNKLGVACQKLFTFQENQNLKDNFASSRMLYSFHNFQLLPYTKPWDVQLSSCLQHAGQCLSMIPYNSNNNCDCSTHLQLFSDFHTSIMSQNLTDRNNPGNNLANLPLFSDPLHFQHKQSCQETSIVNPNIMKGSMRKMMFNDPNVDNPSLSRLPYVNPSSWMCWNHATFNNIDTSLINVGSTLETMVPPMQPLMSSLLNGDQIFPSEEKFYYDSIGYEKQK